MGQQRRPDAILARPYRLRSQAPGKWDRAMRGRDATVLVYRLWVLTH